MIDTVLINQAKAEADSFVKTTPDYRKCQENCDKILAYYAG